MILNKPTQNINIKTKTKIHQLLQEITNQKSNIIMINNNLSKILQHSNHILIFHTNQISTQFDTQNTTTTKITKITFPNKSNSTKNSTNKRKISTQPF